MVGHAIIIYHYVTQILLTGTHTHSRRLTLGAVLFMVAFYADINSDEIANTLAVSNKSADNAAICECQFSPISYIPHTLPRTSLSNRHYGGEVGNQWNGW